MLLDNDQPQEAIRTLERIDTSVLSTNERLTYHHQLVIAKILIQEFDQAFTELEKMVSPNDSVEMEIRFLYAFILNELENCD